MMDNIYELVKKLSLIVALCLMSASIAVVKAFAGERIPLQIKQNIPGAPQLLGIPFPKGKLFSSEQVRILNSNGAEIPSQITVVNTWEPASGSIKWIWVFFFSEAASNYTLEYGKGVVRKTFKGERVIVENNQRPNGRVKVNTGLLQFTINRLGGGFLDKVELDIKGDGFDKEDLIAESSKTRGTFLDILDEAGIDPSRAKITHTVMEKGSGPLHAIVRIEGVYLYNRKDNNPSPFVMRIHAYAGKSYIRILHTITYTGEPDKHKKVEGEYAAIATQNKKIINEEELKNAPGWTEPNDQIAATGFMLDYNLNANKKFRTGYFDGSWTAPGPEKIYETVLSGSEDISVLQTGQNVSRVPPLPNSSNEKQIAGFKSTLAVEGQQNIEKERMPGWITLSDEKWGVGIGIRNFFEEYPKEIAVQGDSSRLFSYIWSPNVSPMGFPRADGESDGGMIGNFAQGLAKTTEIVYQFFKTGTPEKDLNNNFRYFMDPPVSHAPPSWYAQSKVYGSFAPRDPQIGELERGLDYKFEWMWYNQKWEPWYGMLDYGDFQTYYFNKNWVEWNNNEPANDYMWWLQFMRTGSRDYYLAGWVSSLHTMDVDNIHWPVFPNYRGESNDAVDYFNTVDSAQPSGTPYLGMGRRHAAQHYTSLLSAHVWVTGWLASYYLAGNHRAFDVAEQTGDFYIRRVFGEHDLRGRHLYLSVWNLSEIYDASKKEKYFQELKNRVGIMLELQKNSDQGGSLVIDRFGYSQVYISQGLYKYYQMIGDPKVKEALITHAKWQRDNPSMNHKMESFLASIHSLLIGYEFTANKSFLNEAVKRAEFLHTEQLSKDPKEFKTQKEFAEALDKVSHLPNDTESFRGETIWKITNGLRIFGWTHIYNVPYLVYWLKQQKGRGGRMNKR